MFSKIFAFHRGILNMFQMETKNIHKQENATIYIIDLFFTGTYNNYLEMKCNPQKLF